MPVSAGGPRCAEGKIVCLQIRILSALINFAKFRLDKMDQIDQYEEMRHSLTPDQFGDTVSCSEPISIIGFIIAMLMLKVLNWVNSIPYLIWQESFFLIY